MATPLRGEAMAPRCRCHPPGRRTVMTTPWFPKPQAFLESLPTGSIIESAFIIPLPPSVLGAHR